ncbi:MAG: PAS domain-containing protein [Flavobacterium sp.]|nr:PAS domain-containing protein [Flavobacterium sp.]
MDLQIYSEAQKVWENITTNTEVEDLQLEIALQKKLLDFFHVGDFYFFLFDIPRGDFRYVSSDISNVLGYKPEEVSVEFILSKVHPDDQATFLNNEKAVGKFFATLTNDQIPKYKVRYDYRVMNSEGRYVRILQQVMTVQYDDDNNVLMTLGVHTDISHLKKDNNSILSFIGMDGEPSYYDVDVEKAYTAGNQIFTKRESEILGLILQGEQSAAIAKKLFISTHTVNTHRKNILAKTNTKSTIELAMKIVSEGLL